MRMKTPPPRTDMSFISVFGVVCGWGGGKRGWEWYDPYSPLILLNRRFQEITGKCNLTVFSYSGRVKSPEWRWQQRRADLRHFEIFRHGPIIIYTRLPARGTYYPISTFPASSECLIGISDAFSAFCLQVSVIFPTCSLYPQQKHAYSALHPQAWTCIYIYIYTQVHA